MLLSTSCIEQPFQLDDIILQCYESKYKNEGYDIKSIIDDYETVLIQDNILKDGTGESYLELWTRIATNKDFPIASSTFREFDPGQKVARETAISIFECESEMLASAKNKNTKWHKIINNFNSPGTAETPDHVYQAMIETMSEEDFNSYYFRLKMFHLFDMANSTMGNRSLMPPDPSD
jgi:hypothetical protein